MKKVFGFYCVIWAVLLALYNVVVFFVKPLLPGYVFVYDTRFWISWGVVITAFVGQIVCAYIAFQAKNAEKLFLNIPLIRKSYGSLIGIIVIGSICMAIPDFSYWITTIVCVLILAFDVIGVIKARAAAEIVSEVGDKVKANTFFIKALTVDAQSLVAKAKTDENKAVLTKVYEAIRYSDPMSSDALESVENQITAAFADLTEAVSENDTEVVQEKSNELIILVNDRNKKCKLLK